MSKKYMSLVQDMYIHVISQVSGCSGITEEFGIRAGLQQGSVLRPYLFYLIMDDTRKKV